MNGKAFCVRVFSGHISILNQRWTLFDREKDKRLTDHQMIHDMRCSIFKTPVTMSRIARAKRSGLLCGPLYIPALA